MMENKPSVIHKSCNSGSGIKAIFFIPRNILFDFINGSSISAEEEIQDAEFEVIETKPKLITNDSKSTDSGTKEISWPL